MVSPGVTARSVLFCVRLDATHRSNPLTATAWTAAIDSLGLSFEAKKFHHRANGKEISRQNPERSAVGYRYG